MPKKNEENLAGASNELSKNGKYFTINAHKRGVEGKLKGVKDKLTTL